MLKNDNPIDILSDLVTGSANDVLAGYQTYEEHEAYLLQASAEYAARGIKLPLDLSNEPEEIPDENHRHKLEPDTAAAPTAGAEKTLLDFG